MARMGRVVVPGLPHHVTQRGNRREPVFFAVDDYRLYRRLIAAAARGANAEIWAYCLMPNHVHLIVTPTGADGLRATFKFARASLAAADTVKGGAGADQLVLTTAATVPGGRISGVETYVLASDGPNALRTA